jgi:hypothetical protein
MSSAAEVIEQAPEAEVNRFALWRRQIAGILRLEVKKNFLGKRAFLVYLLALLPVILIFLLALVGTLGNSTTTITDAHGHIVSQTSTVRTGPLQDSSLANLVFANIFVGLIVRTVLFFGCAWTFMNLFRGEVVDKSLHYYFLAPVRREVLVAGKYISGLLSSLVLFEGTTILSILFVLYGRGYAEAVRYLFDGPGLGQAGAYVGITALAIIGYGAVFLLIGLLFRNPVIPAILFYGWEWLNFLLPPMLKKISVIHYLESLTPFPISGGPFAIPVEPTPAWLSIPGLFVFTAIVLFVSSLQIRRMEIRYGSD